MRLTIWLISLICLIWPIPAFANTDPKSATPSATATVPTTTPTIGDTTAPTTPILIRPVDGTYTGDNRPEFVWRASSDPNGNSLTYTLHLDGVATYLGISNVGNSTGRGYTARLEGTEIKLLPTLATLDGPHTWYVTASDLSGNTSHSTTWSFTIDTVSPHVLITNIDTYHNLLLDSQTPEMFTNLNFDLAGPKDIYFTIESESWSTLTLQFYDSDNQLITQSSWPINQTGLAHPYQHLELGVYRVIISSFDRGGNTTALPDFQLSLTQAQVVIPLPPIPGLPTSYTVPYTPYSIPSLPATISQLQTTRYQLPILLSILLAVIIALLLILLWKRRYNLILLDSRLHPLTNTKIYHSNPPHPSTIYQLPSTKFGRLYIPHLGRYSTLTVITPLSTHVFSISLTKSRYTIIL